jgi:hypothetical protein
MLADCLEQSSPTMEDGDVRINGSKAIYYNNERIKTHLFNACEK